MEDFHRMINERKKNNIDKKKDYAKRKLKDDVKKKNTTTMIGAIAVFEKFFGYLWGIDKPYEDLTVSEKKFDKLWQEARKEIMDKGNLQIHSILNEIDNYTIEWNGYRINFVFNNKS